MESDKEANSWTPSPPPIKNVGADRDVLKTCARCVGTAGWTQNSVSVTIESCCSCGTLVLAEARDKKVLELKQESKPKRVFQPVSKECRRLEKLAGCIIFLIVVITASFVFFKFYKAHSQQLQ